MIGLGGATILACLTTAIAQATAVSDYFVEISDGHLSYQWMLAGACLVSMAMAMIGVDRIVMFSDPIYTAVYPVILSLFVLGLFQKFIPNDGSYKGAVLLTLVYSTCEALVSISKSFGVSFGSLKSFVTGMPLAAQGFGWVIPFAVGFIIGTLVYPAIQKSKAEKSANS